MCPFPAIQSKQAGITERAENALPLSFAQQRLWFLAQIEGVSEAYHLPMGLRLSGELDRHSLKRALDRIVWRHEALRTTFHRVNGQPEQRVAADGNGFELQDHDLSGHPEMAAELERRTKEEAIHPFDLEHGPLIRGQLMRVAAQEHVLLITMHHIVSDNWSMGVFANELSTLYGAYSAGGEDPLPPLAIQYADYALWQRQRLTGEVLERESEYWLRTLEGAPSLLEMPTDRPRPAQQTFAGDVVALELDAVLTRGLKSLSHRHGMTPEMMVVAGWVAVLSRLSGQEEVVIGTALPNRMRPEIERLIGFFVNTLALRVEVTGSVAELLEQVKAGMVDAQEHRELPFEQVVEIVKPPRSLAHAPIFQVMLVWQDHDGGTRHLPGLRLVADRIVYGVAEFDLELNLGEVDGRIAGGAKYATALFDRGTIERHAGYLRQALAAMITDELQAVDHINLLNDAERDSVLKLGDGGPSVEPIPGSLNGCLYDLVAAQAERTPHAVAVMEPGGKITYKELVQRANGVGRQLSESGVGPEIRVAILTDRSAESLVGVLGILAAGAAYIPLDPSYPDERVAFILDDASVRVLLTPAALVERASSVARRATVANKVVVIAAAPRSVSPPNAAVTPANAAYVIYTSGSTGTPKGVVVNHRGVVNLVQGFIARHNFAGHRLLMVPPLFFDASVGDVFPALIAGATLVLHPAPAELGSLELEQFCREFKITAIDAPTVLWRRWTEGFASYMDKVALLPDLTLMMFGGESGSLEQVRRFAQLTGNRVLLANHYGPTEASVCATMLTTRDGSELSGAELPIGRPLPGVRVYVLDQYLQLTPREAEGELCIGGIGVAREYLGLPEVSVERFVRDPFSADAAARMYRTGDIARWNADCTLQFIGRRDRQVKIRGLRIELGEIEARLAEHPSVGEAVVLAREDDASGKRLVAYVTARRSGENGAGAASMDVGGLRAHLSSQLPEYMVPAAYVMLAKFPLTANGKLDRKALPAPDGDAYVTRGFEAPVGEVETAVARIWAEVLKLERVGRNDNFFELGGHSLLAVTVVERMREAGLPVEMRALFASPALKGLAESVGAESRTVVVPPNLIPAGCTAITPAMLPLLKLSQSEIDKILAGVPGGAENVQDIYPLAPLQEGILFHHLLEKEGDVYLAPTLFSIDSREHVNRYVEALQLVIGRHDILRTAVVWEGLPEPVQVVWRQARLIVEEVRLDPAVGDIAEQLRSRFDPRHYRLDVRQAPLWRLFIAEDVPNNRWLILELMHHLAGDHVTLQVMQQEIQTIVSGQAEKLPLPLPFRNFVAQARLGVSRKEHEAFFTRMLGDVDEPTAPFGLTDVQGDGSQIVETRREIDAELSQRLRAQARAFGVTAASVCHLAWALVLARASGRDDVVFGTVMFGRMQGGDGADRVIGIFINTLPVRIKVGDEGVGASVRQTHELLTQLLRHEHAPLTLAQACSSVQAPAPLFTSLLNYRHVGDGEAVLVRDAVSLHSGDSSFETRASMKLLEGWERTNYPFGLYVNDLGQGLSLDVQVDPSIDPQRVCAMMHTAMESLVAALERNPAIAVCRLDVLPHAERHQLLVEWNDTGVAYAKDRRIHELFEEQVKRTPGATAVVLENEKVSYEELNRRANQLAHHLRGLGVKADDRVALCAERSVEMVVAILAVLKAGGGYVPLDPAYPVERLEYMLADSAPVVLLVYLSAAVRSDLSAVLTIGTTPVVDLEADVDAWMDEPEVDLNAGDIGLKPEHLAYVIYTSGSTGKPKGVMVEHANVVRLFSATDDWFHFDRNDVWTLFHSYAFDFSVWEIWGALAYGGKLVVVPQETTRSPQEFYKLLCAEGVTILNQTPSAFRQLIAAQGDGGAGHHLRHVIFGGEALEVSSLRPWYEREANGETRLINMYGITETTVHVTYRPLEKMDSTMLGPSPIGRRIPDLRIYILDAHRQPAPIGVAGEMYVGGAGVARGYLNRAELTAERFMADPFSANPQARIYRTGDIGRFLPDGNIEYLGRNDHQVKIRGFRIELGEIEARLSEHPSVGEAVVLAREDAAADKRLVAYVTAKGGSEDGDGAIDVKALRAHVGLVLPEYMVPAAYVTLAKFPLTANGKLDRKALPAPDVAAYAMREYEAPAGQVESTVARIWAEVLKRERVSRNDNFFELGGHSLLAITLIERMREAGLAVEIRALFTTPMLRDFAGTVGGKGSAVVAPPNLIPAGCTAITPAMLPLVSLSQSEINNIVAGVPGGAGNIQDIYPLAPLQEGIFFHHRLEKEGDVYLTTKLLGVESRERLDRYAEALQAVIDRNDILRTAVVWEGLPEPVQVVWRHARLSVEEIKLDPTAGDIAEQLRSRFDPRHYRLDVRRAPMWRLFIAEDLPNNRWVILELSHHLVDDNTSIRFLLREIQAILQGQAESLPEPLPFRNFVAQARLGVSREEHESFFTRMLRDVDEPTLPFGLTNVQGDGSQIIEGSREVDSELCQRLRTQARALGVTMATMSHLAWALVVARTSGRDDVVFGTVMFGRLQGGEGADRSLGIFINTLPVRIPVRDESVRASVRKTHELLTQLLKHEHASLALVQRCSSVRAPAPLFTSILNYRHIREEAAKAEKGVKALPDWVGMEFLGADERTNYPFTLAINDLGEELSLEVKVDASVDPQQVCGLMHTAMESLADALDADPGKSIRTLEVLPPAEREQIVSKLNQTKTEYPPDKSMHVLFEEQAERTPELRAVASQGQALSYRELNERANQLGHYLRKQGVGPDGRVGICMKRGVEMIVGLLGIMKAGAAYVPLDPGYPEERLRYMMEDAGIWLVVTQQGVEEVLRRSGTWLICVDEEEERARIEQESQRNPEPTVQMENLAYVIYTSGSTGKAKGVGIEHRQLVNYVRGISQDLKELGLGVGAKYATVSTLSADLGNTVIYPSLVSGGELHVIGEDHVMEGKRLGEYFEREQIDCLKIVPSHLEGLRGVEGEKVIPGKVLVVGGEASSWKWVREWKRASGCAVLNHYGPTETTVGVLRYRVGKEAGVERGEETVPIGQPLGNVRVYVVDPEMELVPVGVPGELYIGGAGVGRGYVNRAELTAERFVPDGFAGFGQRLYRTGDVVRWRRDGNIEFLGRIDHQVKIRGFRIELGEIEAVLRVQRGVEQAVVVAADGQNGNKRLVAYITAGSTEDGAARVIDVEGLRARLSSQLPEYMVPAAYVTLAKLPLTANGKLDRKALPDPDAGAYVTHGYEEPAGEVEIALARIWAEVLKLERVGRNDNFFELGGHSLLAITVIERMREAGLMLEVGALFESPTLKGLAEAAGGEDRTVVAPPNLIPSGCAAITPAMLPLISLTQNDIDRIVAEVPEGAENVQDIYPLAPLQEGILFHHLLEKEGDVYLTPTLLAGSSRERLDRYVKALQAVIDRHDILRTAVVWEGLPEPVQVVWRHATLSVEEVRLDPADGDIAEQLYARFSPRHYRLDVRRAPLWRQFIAQDVPNNRWVMLELSHHLVADNTSIRFLLHEIQTILQGQAEQLPAPLPFRNFVAQARLGVSREEHEAFFTRMLNDVDEPSLPFGLTNVQGDGSQIVEGHRHVDSELSQRLRTHARALGVTVATMCHLAGALVLARASGRDDVVFGTVMFGRMQGGEGADSVMGIFINTLPLRIQVRDEGVRASVRKTHELLTQLFRHEHASLALAQRCSSVRAPAPLFTSYLNYRHFREEAVGAEKGAEDTSTIVGLDFLGGRNRTNYPFGLAINDLGQELSLGVQVEGSVDPERVCALMHTAMESLVDALERAPESAVRSLQVLPEQERQQLLYAWNATEAEYPPDKSIHVLFEEQAERTPELRAVASHGEALSYKELNRCANRLGHYLRNQGLRPDDRVGICMKRGIEMVVGLLGIIKAGGAYVPLDPGYPEERLRYMVEDAGAKIVVTQQELAEGLSGSGALLVCVDEEEERAKIEQESQQNPEPTVQMENLAYVIYTSGSTGKAKGVGIEHRQLVNYVRGISQDLKELGLGVGAKYATVSTLSADLGNTVIYPSLVSGGELHVIGEDHVMEGKRLGEYFEREQIDCLKIVPSHLEGVRGVKGGEKVMPGKVLVVGGEASSWKWVREWRRASGCAVLNHYGPTETTVGVLRYRVGKETGVKRGEETVPIGQPLGNVRVYVVDPEMELVPVGVPGELYIGGAGVGRGYVNRAELTAERFVPDGFAGFGQRLYRTGDVVRWRRDGNIEFLGRIDHQVKIRGFRIELGEIEAVLRAQPEVEQAAVVVAADQNGGKRLVAYVTAAGSSDVLAAAAAIDVEALRARLSSQLPEYMVPAAYVTLAKLPLTANGKLDRKALPDPDAGAYVTHGYEAPVGEVEISLARIWAEVLKLERVGRNDNFFELGGHSLLAITVIERMREAGLPMEIRTLFTAPTLKELATAAGGEDRTVVAPPNLIPEGCTAITPAMLPLISLAQNDIDRIVAEVPGGAENVQDIYPLAPLQEGILFHHLLEKEGDVYLTPTLLAGSSRERLDRYAEALQAVIDRHDILRTAVVWEDLPEPVQVVWRHAPLTIEEVRLDPAAGNIAEQLYARFNPGHYRLDVRRAPLWRLFIAEDLPNNRWVMFELKHHLTGDNTSAGFLLREIQTILQGQAEQLPAPLPFRNFVAQARLGVSREEHEAFFTRMLKDVDEPTLPFGLANVQGDGSRIVEGSRKVDSGLNQRLRIHARALGVTMATMCHLAWAMVLARISGRDDVVFGTVMFGRMQGGEGADRGLGIFINTLPLRIRVGDESVRASVRKTHELLTQLFRHEHASLALVQRCSSVEAPAPLFTSLLDYRHVREHTVSSETTQAMVGLELLESRRGRTNYPVVLYINDLGQELSIEVQMEGAIDPQRVCKFVYTAMESLAEALERAPESGAGSLAVLPEEERQQVLYEWNATGAAYPQDKCLHELFEEQVERTPGATAVVFENESLNYAELNRRANRLARYLRGIGVKADERVGICAERGIEMVVSLLAVLKAGGAYMPMDPEYPDERLQYMVKNSKPVAVLTQEHLQERLNTVSAASGVNLPVIDLRAEAVLWQEQGATNCGRDGIDLSPASLAYVIYTSGSTGTPKGVMIEHKSIANRLLWMQNAYELKAEDAVLQKTPFSFDVSVWEFFWTLLTGARLVMAWPGGHKDPKYLCEAIERNQVTTLHFVPSMLQVFLEHGDGGRCSSVKRIICSGEALSGVVARRCREVLPWAELHNLYGPTEAAVDVTAWTYSANGNAETTIPIGRPIANTQMYILDRKMEPVPVGVVGELYIGGVQVARGYLNRDDLTAERFVRDPFAAQQGMRVYRTGDLGRWLEDGNIEYLGRNDFQVKSRGFRIELGEIEARLLEHAGVRETVVVAREDSPGELRLVAYYVDGDEGKLGAEELRRHLAGRLPEYMVPAAYVSLEKLPLSANGKLDRKALPAPAGDAYSVPGYEPPQGEVETALVDIWADILQLKRIGRNDNFFELGGHSLLAMRLINRIHVTMGADVQLRDIFAAKTIKDMATVLSALRGLNELISAEPAGSSEGRYL